MDKINKLIKKTTEITESFLPKSDNPNGTNRGNEIVLITKHIENVTNLVVGSGNWASLEIELMGAGTAVGEIIRLNEVINNENANNLLRLKQELVKLWKLKMEEEIKISEFYQNESKKAQENIASLKGKISELDKELVKSKERELTRENYISQLEGLLEEKEAEKDLKEEKKITKEVKNNKQTIEKLEKENKSLLEENKKAAKHREELVKKHAKEKDELEYKLEDYKTENISLGERNTYLSKKISELEAKAKNQEETSHPKRVQETQNETVEKLVEKVKELEAEKEKQTREIEELEKENKELREWKANYKEKTPFATPVLSRTSSIIEGETLKGQMGRLHLDGLPSSWGTENSASPKGYCSSPSPISSGNSRPGSGVWNWPQNIENIENIENRRRPSSKKKSSDTEENKKLRNLTEALKREKNDLENELRESGKTTESLRKVLANKEFYWKEREEEFVTIIDRQKKIIKVLEEKDNNIERERAKILRTSHLRVRIR